MRKIIGIVPATDPIDLTQNSMSDRYYVGNNYSKQAAAVGIPIGLSPVDNTDIAKHDVTIVPGTLLHRVLERDTMRIVTYHDLSTPLEQTLVTVNAWCGDVVEGTEYGENILGVQGHPEMDALLPELFAFLTA